jgi:peptide subunit release factor 1 (eRF1)
MSDSSDEADEEIVLQENSEKFELEEGEHVDAIRQKTRNFERKQPRGGQSSLNASQ